MNRVVLWLLIAVGFIHCSKPTERFHLLSPNQSGINFINQITEDDSLNILVSEFVYNGAGIAVGDLNGDGWEDLFFAGNQVENQLYLNRQQLRFEDISRNAGISKPDSMMWSSGVNILDINLDGKLDIYICNTLRKDPSLRRNLLFINLGNDQEGVPRFEELGESYGLADTSHSSHAQFFDYDLDGDLDLFIGVNLIEGKYANTFIELKNDGSALNRDRLLRNEWSDSLGHPVFTDVSLESGLVQDGYSHSTLILDFNDDGWPDIYVANDYESNDLIFINNQDGTFTDKANEIFKHLSLSAMGSDVGDIDNDGLMDVVTTEMQPYYNKRKKLFQGESSYQREILTRQYGYQYQYTRNTLQWNRGLNPMTGLPIYSEMGMFAQIQQTDWSWATLIADFDNDCWQDIYIANGFPKDVTDRDFADFRAYASQLVSREEMMAAIPEVKSPNFMYRNLDGLSFEDITSSWGLDIPSFSNGAAYGDLDKDGDLDLIVNNIDDHAFLLENRESKNQMNFFRIRLIGPHKNPDAFGTSVVLYIEDKFQKRLISSGRGYLSKSENTLHFGLGHQAGVDSVVIYWPDKTVQKLGPLSSNQELTVKYDSEQVGTQFTRSTPAPMLKEVSAELGLQFNHQEIDFVDFNFQRTLPHKFSQFGPAMSVGDFTGDGLDDFILGAGRGFAQTIFIQQKDGNFIQKETNFKLDAGRLQENAGILLFDADQDGDLDLYLSHGGAQEMPGHATYQDMLLINDGTGQFTLAMDALPPIKFNSSCVKAADFDRDGDLDLFVGSRVLPRHYPYPDRSVLLRNDTGEDQIRFTDVTETLAPDLISPGLISDALWTDCNGDFWPDLLLAGEWMPLTLFINERGQLTRPNASTGLEAYRGWWNSLSAADLDNDGDIDYVAGNFGENLNFRCSAEEPLRIYGKDLDGNGSIDPLISCYWPDSLGNRKEFLYHPRQDVIKQFVGIRKRYNTFAEFGEATVPEMFSGGEMEDALILSANWLKTSWIENLGHGQFKVHALPREAQLAPVYGIVTTDVNQDGFVDILMVGNDFGMEVQQGRADALMGLILLNRSNVFQSLTLSEGGFFVPGDGKSLVAIVLADGTRGWISAENNGPLRAFKTIKDSDYSIYDVKNNECSANIQLKNGRTRREEFSWGSGFQSSSSRFLVLDASVQKIELFDQNGQLTRNLP